MGSQTDSRLSQRPWLKKKRNFSSVSSSRGRLDKVNQRLEPVHQNSQGCGFCRTKSCPCAVVITLRQLCLRNPVFSLPRLSDKALYWRWTFFTMGIFTCTRTVLYTWYCRVFLSFCFLSFIKNSATIFNNIYSDYIYILYLIIIYIQNNIFWLQFPFPLLTPVPSYLPSYLNSLLFDSP